MTEDKASAPPNVLEQVLAQRESVVTRLAQIGHVVAVMSGKGGVGKSALTANFAAALGMQGLAVGVMDADIHGASATTMLGAHGQKVAYGPAGARPAIGVANIRVMSMDLFLPEDEPVHWQNPGGLAADAHVWRGSMEANALLEMLADTDWGRLDWLLIDMPPGTDRYETLLELTPDLYGTIVVTIPSQVAHRVVRRSITAAQTAGASLLGLVENMAGYIGENGREVGELFPEGGGQEFAALMDIPYLGRVPFDSRLARETDGGRPFVLEHAESIAGQAILAIVEELATEVSA